MGTPLFCKCKMRVIWLCQQSLSILTTFFIFVGRRKKGGFGGMYLITIVGSYLNLLCLIVYGFGHCECLD